MARHVVKTVYQEEKLVNIESAADKELSDVFVQCLETVGYAVERKKTENKTETAAGEI